jgi:hypothetical protein
MHFAAICLGCLLAGQAPDLVLSAPASQEKRSPAALDPEIKAASATAEISAPVGPASSKPAGRPTPPDMVANAMTLPTGSTVAGQPWTLLNVLSTTADRGQQLELTRAYWRLVQAVGEYHYCADHATRLARLKASEAAIRLRQAEAGAMLRQAELGATEAQYELARLLRLSGGAALPLPADRPHVGAYRTNFQALFGGRTAPEPAMLMDRLLPIRRRAIDEHAAAVEAAGDVLTAAADPQAGGRGDPADLAACSRDLLAEQRKFLRTVCEYNRNIAEYALAVTGPTTSPQGLVAILIGSVQQVTAAAAVQPAGASQPMLDPPRQATRSGWQTAQPTPAPPRDAGKKNEPTLAPPRDALQAVGKNEPTLAPPRDSLPAAGKNEPTLAPPRDSSAAAGDRTPQTPPQPQTRTANKPVITGSTAPTAPGESAAAIAAASPLYAALRDAAPGVRTKELIAVLCWDRSLPKGVGQPISLLDCLLRDSGTDRQATINAFWLLRRRAAEYQVLAQQVELLEAFEPLALAHRKTPTGAVDMLRLRRAELAADAALREAHVALIEAQYRLALRIGATGDAAWPLASTVPHGGKYLMMVEAQPQAVAQSWPVRRLAATIPHLAASVEQHAASVVESDTARVDAAEKYRAGGPIDAAVEGVATQTGLTLALLETVTDYNGAIAEYVLTVLPPTVTADRLVPALVLKP